LYSLNRPELGKESVWKTLSDLLHNDNLQNRNVLKKIDGREREIKDAMGNEDRVKQEYDSKIESIDSDVETKEEEIEQLKKEKERLVKEAETKICEMLMLVYLGMGRLCTSTTLDYFKMNKQR